MGGGGSSGAISYPDYMQCVHHGWLQEIDNIRSTAAGNNPYTGGSFDFYGKLPDARSVMGVGVGESFDDDPNAMLGAFESFNAVYNMDTKIPAYYNTLQTLLQGSLTDQDLIDSINSMLESTGKGLLGWYDQHIGRFEAEAVNAGAVMSSTFIYARNAMSDRIDDYLRGLYDKIIMNMANAATGGPVLQGALNMGELDIKNMQQQLQQVSDVARHSIDGSRILFEAAHAEASTGVEVQAKGTSWALTVWEEPIAVMASIAGAASTKKQDGPSSGQKAIAGMASGAAVGAQAGAGNPYAIAAGAVIGGLAGLLS